MPFAYCLECGDQALIDPSGSCPVGHRVGAAGARVTAALGTATPHPDEPVPWVRTVELDAAAVDAAARVARPPSVATTDDPEQAPVGGADEAMRELQALGALDELAGLADLADGPSSPATPAPVVTPAAATPAPVTPAAAAPAPVVPPATAPDAPAASGVDELASLAAALKALDAGGPATPPPAASASAPAPSAAPAPAPSAAPAPAPSAAPAPAPAPVDAFTDELDDLFAADVRREALADVAAIDRAAASPPPPPSSAPVEAPADASPADAAPAAPRQPVPAAVGGLGGDGLEFTARSGRARRSQQPVEARTKRGLFRR